MSIQALQGQSSGVYQIRKREEVQEAGQVQAEQVVQEVVQQSDEYDKANPVGEEAEGIYSVTFDSDGHATVKYTQPGAKAEAAEGAQASGAAAVSDNSDSTDSTEEEIEALKKQRDQIKQQLNKSQDEEEKKALRAQLQMIEAQIAQKTAELNS